MNVAKFIIGKCFDICWNARNYYRIKKLRKRTRNFGKRVTIGQDFKILFPGNLTLGNDVSIGNDFYCACSSKGTVEIGDDTAIAARVMILTATHDMYLLPVRSFGINKGVKIGKNVWVGAGAIILPGVTIGDGAMVAAGAVVAKNVEVNHLVGGVPARTIRVIERKGEN